MPLTRRIQVYISAEASEALDGLVGRGMTQTLAVEVGLVRLWRHEQSVVAAGSRTTERVDLQADPWDVESAQAGQQDASSRYVARVREAGQVKADRGKATRPRFVRAGDWSEVDPEKAIRAERKKAKAGRKAELVEGVKAELCDDCKRGIHIPHADSGPCPTEGCECAVRPKRWNRAEGVKAALPHSLSGPVAGFIRDDVREAIDKQQGKCLHPAGSRTAGKDWRCTACGYQHKAAS